MLADVTVSTALQGGLLVLASLAFLAAFIWAVPNLRGAGEITRSARWPMVQFGIVAGVVLALVLLGWRAAAEPAGAKPFYNYLDAFIILALLLTGLLVYFRWTRYLKGLALFLLPMIAGVLLLGGLLDLLNYRDFHDATPWMIVHLVTIILGTACFAAACVCGAVYLLVDRQLRHKGLDPLHRWSGLPPLASMERFMQRAIFLGFPLLTIAIITGVLRAVQQPALMNRGLPPKVGVAAATWIIYALLLHVRWTPSVRGARAAWLSIIGFALLMTAFLIVSLSKGG